MSRPLSAADEARPDLRPSLLPELARVIAAAAIAGGVVLAYAVFRIYAQGHSDERRPADAIVVLGAAQYDGQPGAVLRARLEHALALYEEGLARFVVVTGGKRPGDRTTEAATSRTWLIDRGVASERILFEDRGRTTLESLAAVETIFSERGFTTGLFVSDRSHMLRVLRMARDLGFEAWGSPTTTSPSDRDAVRWSRAALHEVAGLAAYYLGVGGLLADAPAEDPE